MEPVGLAGACSRISAFRYRVRSGNSRSGTGGPKLPRIGLCAGNSAIPAQSLTAVFRPGTWAIWVVLARTQVNAFRCTSVRSNARSLVAWRTSSTRARGRPRERPLHDFARRARRLAGPTRFDVSECAAHRFSSGRVRAAPITVFLTAAHAAISAARSWSRRVRGLGQSAAGGASPAFPGAPHVGGMTANPALALDEIGDVPRCPPARVVPRASEPPEPALAASEIGRRQPGSPSVRRAFFSAVRTERSTCSRRSTAEALKWDHE
jgi:hypothetical protein